MKTVVNPVFATWKKNDFPHILNGVLESVLVCAQFSSKQAHDTKRFCFLTQLFRSLGLFQIIFYCYAKTVLWGL